MADQSAASTTETTAPAQTTTTETTTASPAAASAAFDWKSLNLAPELQNVVDRHQFSDPSMVVKSYGEFEKLHGVPVERLVKLPSPNEAKDPKAWDSIYNKLGRPETADKYILPVPKGDDGTFSNQIKPWLHEAGVSQAGAVKLAEKWNSFQEAQANAMKAQREAKDAEQVQELKLAWGSEFDSRAQLVDTAAEKFGMTANQVQGLKTALGPKDAMEFLYNIGAKLGVEDRTVPGIGGETNGFTQMTPEMAKAEIVRLRSDKDFARLFNSSDIKQKMEARQQMDRLQRLANPGFTKADMIGR